MAMKLGIIAEPTAEGVRWAAEKGLGYCAGQTERTLAQISPAGTEIDYAIIYADYYYIEALLRLKDKKI